MLEDRLHNFDDIVFSCFLPDDWLNAFRMPQHVLVYVYAGIMNVEYNGTSFSVKAGQYVFLKRNHVVRLHKTSYEGETYKAINIRLENKVLRQYVNNHKEQTGRIREKRRITDSAVILPRIAEIESLFDSLMPYYDKSLTPPDGFTDEAIDKAIACLLMMDEKFYPTLFDFLDTWKINLPEFMEENFTNDMTIREFALYTGRSLATFKRDFAKFSNLSPEKWLVVRRLEAAYKLLKEGKESVSEVCWSVGFHSRSHFTTAFKRQYNILPSDIAARDMTCC